MLNLLPLHFLEKTINHLLSFAVNYEHLTKLEGKSVSCKLLELDKPIVFSFTNNQINLSDTPINPNATISTPVAALIKLLAQKDLTAATNNGLTITGDLEIATAMYSLMHKLNIDWEAVLAQFTGGFTARQISNTVKSLRAKHPQVTDDLAEMTAEYLKEEIRVTPSNWELQDFCEQVNLLRDDIDRVTAKLQQLEKNL